MFADQFMSVARLDGDYFNEDNHRFYTSLRVAVYSCRLNYSDKHDKMRDGRDSWKYFV